MKPIKTWIGQLLGLTLTFFTSSCRTPSPIVSNHPEPLITATKILLRDAQSYLKQGNFNATIQKAQQAALQTPDEPQAYVIWGQALMRQGDLANSQKQFEQARQLGSRNPELFAELANLYDMQKKYEQAVEIYVDYLTDHPQDTDMRDELATTLLLLNQPEQAIHHLQLALNRQPNNVLLQEDLAMALIQAKQHAEAEKLLLPLTQQDPNSTNNRAIRLLLKAWLGLVDTYISKHAPSQAQSMLNQAAQYLGPSHPSIQRRQLQIEQIH